METLDLKKLREVAEKASPGPWGPWMANIPFYIEVQKPSPSLSKHDDERPTYWACEDALFVLHFNPKTAIMLLNRIEELENKE